MAMHTCTNKDTLLKFDYSCDTFGVFGVKKKKKKKKKKKETKDLLQKTSLLHECKTPSLE